MADSIQSGENVNDRVFRRGTLATAGRPLDAGTVQLHLEGDLAQLVRASYRHWVTDIAEYTPFKGEADSRWFADLVDARDGGDATHRSFNSLELTAISWTPTRSARRYGPFPALFDRVDGGTLKMRRLRVEVLATCVADLTLYFMLSGPSPAPEAAIAGAGVVVSAGARQWITHTLTATMTALPAPTPRGVRETSSGHPPVTVAVTEVYLWVGWLSTNGGNILHSINAYEVPE